MIASEDGAVQAVEAEVGTVAGDIAQVRKREGMLEFEQAILAILNKC